MTGPPAVLTICRRLKTDRLPSPNSKTNRDCSPSTTPPGCTGAVPGSCLPAPASPSGVGGEEEQPGAARGRYGELLRLQPLAEDGRRHGHACPGRQAGELGTARGVGLHRARRAGAEQFDRLIGNVVGERALDDADDHGADGDVGDRQRNSGNRPRIRSAARDRARNG